MTLHTLSKQYREPLDKLTLKGETETDTDRTPKKKKKGILKAPNFVRALRAEERGLWRKEEAEPSRSSCRRLSSALSPQQRWNRRNPHAMRCHAIVYRAKQAGDIVPEPCEICGAPAEAHHHDYSMPLDVTWLCRQHHQRLHARGDIADLFPAGGRSSYSGTGCIPSRHR